MTSSTQYGATWPTVVDPDKAIKAAYRVAARPQSYFVDRTGVIRSIQVGELTDADFERAVRPDRAMTTGDPMVVVDGLVKRYGRADGPRRRLADGRRRRARRAPRTERRRQDDDGRDHRGLPPGAMAGRSASSGSDPATGGPALRARVGLMLQDGGIDPRAQPRETLRQYGRFHADPRDADELLDLVGLRAVARTRYRRLSGGERQRLGLALALVGRPEVVILDEPTAGMDPEARATTRAIVADLRDERRRDPADEPRPDRRRAAGRPDLRPRRRPDRRGRDARPSCAPGRRHGSGSGSTGRSAAAELGGARAPRSAAVRPGARSCPMATARAIDSTARSRTRRSWPRSPRWCADGRSAHRRAADRRAAASRTSTSSWSARAGRPSARPASRRTDDA